MENIRKAIESKCLVALSSFHQTNFSSAFANRSPHVVGGSPQIIGRSRQQGLRLVVILHRLIVFHQVFLVAFGYVTRERSFRFFGEWEFTLKSKKISTRRQFSVKIILLDFDPFLVIRWIDRKYRKYWKFSHKSDCNQSKIFQNPHWNFTFLQSTADSCRSRGLLYSPLGFFYVYVSVNMPRWRLPFYSSSARYGNSPCNMLYTSRMCQHRLCRAYGIYHCLKEEKHGRVFWYWWNKGSEAWKTCVWTKSWFLREVWEIVEIVINLDGYC